MANPTLLELSERTARDLRDTDGKTFDPLMLRDLVNDAIIEVSRISPLAMQEDITPIADAFLYATRITEPIRVELWTVSPLRPYSLLRPAAGEFSKYSEVGYDIWRGSLRLTSSWVDTLNSAIGTYRLRLWGYGPRLILTDLTDVAELDDIMESAVYEYASYRGYDALVHSRVLFTQWQSQPDNNDVSLGQLHAALSSREQQWNRRRKQLTLFRA